MQNFTFEKNLERLNHSISLTVSISLFCFLIFSQVPIKFFFLPEVISTIAVFFYATILGLIPFYEKKFIFLHRIGAPLAVFIFSGRGLGFLNLVVSEGRYDLIAAVAERVTIILLLLLWHVTAMYRILGFSRDTES